jgi:hypothetical protein
MLHAAGRSPHGGATFQVSARWITGRRLLAFLSVVVAVAAACDAQSRESASVAPPPAHGGRADLTLGEARDSARAFIARSSAASQVFLDSSAVEKVDSLWRITFRRRQLVVPNVVTVDVHERTGAMRFPGDE